MVTDERQTPYEKWRLQSNKLAAYELENHHKYESGAELTLLRVEY